MSDFALLPRNVNIESCVRVLGNIYPDSHQIFRFFSRHHTLIVSQNHYHGFQPYVWKNKVCIIIGGPVLNFENAEKRDGMNNNSCTRKIFERWILDGNMSWESDLDGPFIAVFFDCNSGEIRVVTDLMSFCPVYKTGSGLDLSISSHINILSLVVRGELDLISVGDLLLNNVVVYPYTLLKKVFQVGPASEHYWLFHRDAVRNRAVSYWEPNEEVGDTSTDLEVISKRLRKGIKSYIDNVLSANSSIAVLVSGGEDSRSVLGMIPKEQIKNGFIFCSNENHEVEIAKKICARNNVSLKIGMTLSQDFFDNIEPCSRLVGVGSDCSHVHSFPFCKKFKLSKYDAVLGGFLADTFLKGLWKNALTENSGSKEFQPNKSDFIKASVIEAVNERRLSHWSRLKKIRPLSVNEWMGIWPMSMQRDIPNIHGHRRLFRSYEPFTCSEVVKVGALANGSIKAKRRLFRMAMKPFLKRTQWIPHNTGFLPYYSSFINTVLFSPFFRLWFKLTGKQRVTLADWDLLFCEHAKNDKLQAYSEIAFEYLGDIFISSGSFLDFRELNAFQKRNLLQIGFFVSTYQTNTKIFNKN